MLPSAQRVAPTIYRLAIAIIVTHSRSTTFILISHRTTNSDVFILPLAHIYKRKTLPLSPSPSSSRPSLTTGESLLTCEDLTRKSTRTSRAHKEKEVERLNDWMTKLCIRPSSTTHAHVWAPAPDIQQFTLYPKAHPRSHCHLWSRCEPHCPPNRPIYHHPPQIRKQARVNHLPLHFSLQTAQWTVLSNV